MPIIGLIISLIISIACLVFWIITLVKMFKTESSPLKGIIGIFCPLWAYIWGWLNASRVGLKKNMILWTIAIILSIVVSTINSISAARNLQNNPGNFNIEQSSMPSLPME